MVRWAVVSIVLGLVTSIACAHWLRRAQILSDRVGVLWRGDADAVVDRARRYTPPDWHVATRALEVTPHLDAVKIGSGRRRDGEYVEKGVMFEPGDQCVSGRYLSIGWPMRSFEGSVWAIVTVAEGGGYREEMLSRSDLNHVWTAINPNVHPNLAARGNGAHPYRPLLLGLVFNTIVFAIPIWVVGMGAYGVRCAVRRRGERCRQCGYRLTCPECGP